MIAVLDASAAVRSVMARETPFLATLKAADLVIAPELIVAEVCSAFQKYVCAHVLSLLEADQSINRALALVDNMQPLRELVVEVLALAGKVEWPVYDLFYLALAQRTGATLLTADVALGKAARKLGLDVSTPENPA